MTFMMKKFPQTHRRGRSLPTGARPLEILECRQLLSSGMQPGEAASALGTFNASGWESRWADLAPTVSNTSGESQVVSNEMIGPFGGNVAFVSDGAVGQVSSGGAGLRPNRSPSPARRSGPCLAPAPSARESH